MRKSLLFVAAMFAAVTVSAKEIVVDLSQAAGTFSSANGAVTPSFASGELTVDWQIIGGDWDVAGVEIPIADLTGVTNVSFEYKGDGADVVIYPYLRDVEGNRWMKKDYWPSAQNTSWTIESFVPDECPWDAATYAFGDKAFNHIGFVANPAADATGKFYLRNVKITVTDATNIDNIATQGKTTKIIRDGQILILRDGKTFNALGAEVK